MSFRIIGVVVVISLIVALIVENGRAFMSNSPSLDQPGAGSYSLVSPPSMDDAILATANAVADR